MRLLAVEPQPDLEAVRSLGVELTDLETALRESDYVSLHVPAAPETQGLINARTLALMRPTAHLINTARGPLVDEEALCEALTSGALAGAGLDVWDPEPPDPASPLLQLENVVATPHIAGASHESKRRAAQQAIQNCLDGVAGRLPPGVVVNRAHE
jgi:phosphoglycerate dehydrogenase-like enzyme